MASTESELAYLRKDIKGVQDIVDLIYDSTAGVSTSQMIWSAVMSGGGSWAISMVLNQLILMVGLTEDPNAEVLRQLDVIQRKLDALIEMTQDLYDTNVYQTSNIVTWITYLKSNYKLMRDAALSNPKSKDSPCNLTDSPQKCWESKMDAAAYGILAKSSEVETGLTMAILEFNLDTNTRESLQRYGYTSLFEEYEYEWSTSGYGGILGVMNKWKGWLASKLQILQFEIVFAMAWLEERGDPWYSGQDIIKRAEETLDKMENIHEDCTAWTKTIPFDGSENNTRRRLYGQSTYKEGKWERGRCYNYHKNNDWYFWLVADWEMWLSSGSCPKDNPVHYAFYLEYAGNGYFSIAMKGVTLSDYYGNKCSGTTRLQAGKTSTTSDINGITLEGLAYGWICAGKKNMDKPYWKLKIRPLMDQDDSCYWGRWENVAVQTSTEWFWGGGHPDESNNSWNFNILQDGSPDNQKCPPTVSSTELPVLPTFPPFPWF